MTVWLIISSCVWAGIMGLAIYYRPKPSPIVKQFYRAIEQALKGSKAS